MIFAQVLLGIIVNVIVLDDPSLAPVFAQGFDCAVRVDNMSPQPQIGWTTSDGCKTFVYAPDSGDDE